MCKAPTYGAYIFDLDGTLLDSMNVWTQIDIDFLTGRGLVVPPDYTQAVSYLSPLEAARYTIGRFGLPDAPQALGDEWNRMAAYAYGNTVPLKPYVKEYLTALHGTGAKLGVATSLCATLYRPALRHHGIDTLFHACASTEEVSHGKARPDVFLLAAQKLGVAPKDCMVFDDIPQAVQSAKDAGMTVYGVYDDASKEHWELIKTIADGVIYNFSQAPLPVTE